MILYLFYNADLLEVTSLKSQAVVTFMDDANLYAEGDTFDNAYDSLHDMLTKTNGMQTWTHTHNSRFEKSKFTLLGFTRRRIVDPSHNGKTIPTPLPVFTYDSTDIQPREPCYITWQIPDILNPHSVMSLHLLTSRT